MDVIKRINDFGWVDWALDSLKVDYERIIIKLIYCSDSINKPDIFATIQCGNFIGFSIIGHWDENIIEHIKIEPKGDLIDDSLRRVECLYGNSPLLGGGMKKIDNKWHQLNVRLIDGNVVKVACDNFEFELQGAVDK